MMVTQQKDKEKTRKIKACITDSEGLCKKKCDRRDIYKKQNWFGPWIKGDPRQCKDLICNTQTNTVYQNQLSMPLFDQTTTTQTDTLYPD